MNYTLIETHASGITETAVIEANTPQEAKRKASNARQSLKSILRLYDEDDLIGVKNQTGKWESSPITLSV